MILGPTRIGKSTVAAGVARALGLRHVQMDDHTYWWHKPEHEAQPLVFLREREARRLAGRIMRQAEGRKAVILDSYMLLSALTSAPRACADWIREGRIVVLSSDASLDDRLAAIHSHRSVGRCWTSGLTAEQVRQVAQRSVRECRMVNDLAERYDFPVHMLDPHAFEASARAAADRIGRLVSGQSAP